MNKRILLSYMLLLASLGFIYLIGSGCSSKISGQFYYDLNSNGSRDSDEPYASHVKVMIKKDGETKLEGSADESGKFSARIKPESGEWCIMSVVSDSNLVALFQGSLPQPAPAAPTAETPQGGQEQLASSEIAIGKSKAAAIAGKTPTTPSEEESATETAEDTEDKEPGSKDESEADKDTEGKDDETKKTDNEETSTQQKEDETSGPKGLCINRTKAYWTKWETKPQGIKINYQKAIADLGERIPKNCYAGQVCEVSMAYPNGCTLKNFEIGEYLSYTSQPTQAAPQGAAATAKATATAPMAELSVSNLKKKTFYLMATASIPPGTTKQTITAEVDCPDGSHNLPAYVVNLINESSISIVPNFEEKGDEFKLTITIENTGKAAIEDGNLTAALSATTKLLQTDSKCNNAGTIMQCGDIKIAAGQSVKREFLGLVFSLDEVPKIDITFESKASGILEEMPFSWIPEKLIQQSQAAEQDGDAPELPTDESDQPE